MCIIRHLFTLKSKFSSRFRVTVGIEFTHFSHVIRMHSDPSILPVQTISIQLVSYQRMNSKTRCYCAVDGCHADTQKKPRIKLSGWWYFNTVVIELNRSFSLYPLPCNLHRHRLELSPGSGSRQGHTILPNLACEQNIVYI